MYETSACNVLCMLLNKPVYTVIFLLLVGLILLFLISLFVDRGELEEVKNES